MSRTNVELQKPHRARLRRVGLIWLIASKRRPARTTGCCDSVQVLVNHLYGYGALAHRRSHPLDRPTSNVPGREHAGNASLQKHRLTLQRPSFGRRSVSQEIATGDYVAPIVAHDLLRKPPGVRTGPYEHEQGRRGERLRKPRGAILEYEVLETSLTTAVYHLGVQANLDVLSSLYLLDQVPGYVGGERLAEHQQRNAPGVFGEVPRRLPGRVPSTNHEDFLSLHALCLGNRSPVEYARSLQSFQAGDAQPAVGCSGGDDRRSTRHLGSV